MELTDIFESCGLVVMEKDPLIEGDHYLIEDPLSWGYWGASEDMWLGGNWVRGKSMKHDIWLKDPDHNFCTILTGARNFFGWL
jgi:hypothetical protein